MEGSRALGCAAKISTLNKTGSIVLQISRTGSQLLITGCAPDRNAGSYRIEVFDVEANGSLSKTAAVVMDIENPYSILQTPTSTTLGTLTTCEPTLKQKSKRCD